ncbi:serine hydrolase domain-containing protein [Larkinella sp. VNQ87]|uniref:serine hydrolase domain-containing protein n=1 Tax=Larkinella sp. VNQ87 TaxID=3400921 RepID=UPI003C0CDEF0
MRVSGIWAGIIAICIIVGCDWSEEKKLKRSAKAMHNCAEDQILTPAQEQAIRREIGADAKIEKIDALIRSKVRAGFNGNVLIAQKGVVLYKKSFGLGHLERSSRDSLNENSKFQLASLSKTFTAVATLKLIEANKLSLTDTIQKFFPDFPYHGITIENLLSHRSGLPNYAYAFEDSMRINFYKFEKPYPTNAEIMHWFANVKPTPQRYNIPGRTFSYSNTNYCVLAAIIEKITGMPFDQFARKNLFEPLGMKNTWVATTRNDSINQDRTAGYQWNRRIPKDYYDNVVGDKGVYSTVGDLFRWYRALNGDCLLRKTLLAEAFLPRSFERKGTKNYGYGFRMYVNNQNQPEYIYHTGWWKGYNSLFWFSPKDDFVIILLGNRYNKSVYQVKELLEVLHGHPSNAEPEAETGEVDI